MREHVEKPDNGVLSKRLYEAQMDFEADLIKEAIKANSIVNAPGAKKYADDAERERDEEAIARETQLLFSEHIKDMIDKIRRDQGVEAKREKEAKQEAEQFAGASKAYDALRTEFNLHSTNPVA